METIKALLVDDERLARNELRKLLAEYEIIEIIDEAVNINEAKAKIEEHQPELVFLDIQMPGGTGFELLEKLDKVPQIIFTTAYDEFALKAFEVNALDYLMKPIEPLRLGEAVNRIKQAKQAQQVAAQNALANSLKENDQVFVKDGEKCWFVKLGEIRYFESVGNYARLYFSTNKPLILKSLNALEERLDEKQFFRANRKHIVNLKMVQKVEPYFNGGLMLELTAGDKIEVSRRQAVKFRELMSL
jgi:two-component system, LytTR family, response regulator